MNDGCLERGLSCTFTVWSGLAPGGPQANLIDQT
jgi:hypothetical protein